MTRVVKHAPKHANQEPGQCRRSQAAVLSAVLIGYAYRLFGRIVSTAVASLWDGAA